MMTLPVSDVSVPGETVQFPAPADLPTMMTSSFFYKNVCSCSLC